MKNKEKLIVILGPTATGKTGIAVEAAAKFNGEVISADSRQVYRGMDVGTGKDLVEYESKTVIHHLIDVCEPNEEFDLYRFGEEYIRSYNTITAAGKLPILCGGSGMYLDAVIKRYKLKRIDASEEYKNSLEALSESELLEKLQGLKENLHNLTDSKDRERIIRALLIAESGGEELKLPNPEILIIGVSLPLKKLRERIEERLTRRLKEGMIEETQRLLDEGITHERLQYFGLEYRYISEFLQGKLNKNDMRQKLGSAIYEFARKQLKWYRKMEREGTVIHWFSPENQQAIQAEITAFLKKDDTAVTP